MHNSPFSLLLKRQEIIASRLGHYCNTNGVTHDRQHAVNNTNHEVEAVVARKSGRRLERLAIKQGASPNTQNALRT